MPDRALQKSEADTYEFWNDKARRNANRPLQAVGVSDPLINQCIENSQRVCVTRGMMSAIRDIDQQCNRVLDFGCGVGRWTPLLRKYFSDYLGVDISDEMIGIARRENPDTNFSQIRDLRVDAPEAAFDFVSSIAVLHHNAYSNQDVLLRELARVIRPGGQLLLFESNGQRHNVPNSIFYPRSESDWVDGARRVGFRHIETSGTAYQFAHRVASRIAGKFHERSPALAKAVFRLDSVITPHLAPWLPRRFHERLLMRFEKE